MCNNLRIDEFATRQESITSVAACIAMVSFVCFSMAFWFEHVGQTYAAVILAGIGVLVALCTLVVTCTALRQRTS